MSDLIETSSNSNCSVACVTVTIAGSTGAPVCLSVHPSYTNDIIASVLCALQGWESTFSTGRALSSRLRDTA